MRRIKAALLLDVRLQGRHRLYHIGIAMALLVGIASKLAFPPEYLGRLISAFYLVALGGTTYMFGASMVLLEKTERTVDALRTSPLTSREYILSKAITLSSFAAVEALIVLAIAGRNLPVSILPLVSGILVLGLAYTFIGMGQVASLDSVTRFLFPGALLVSLVLQLPFLHILEIEPGFLWYLVPTQAPLLLILGAFEDLARWQWTYAITVSVILLVLSYAYARARFRRHIHLPER